VLALCRGVFRPWTIIFFNWGRIVISGHYNAIFFVASTTRITVVFISEISVLKIVVVRGRSRYQSGGFDRSGRFSRGNPATTTTNETHVVVAHSKETKESKGNDDVPSVPPDSLLSVLVAMLVAAVRLLERHAAHRDLRKECEQLARALADAGIDMEDVTKTLLDEGIDKFVEPFDKLIAGIEEQMAKVGQA